MDTIHIAFCADENYATYIPTLLHSAMTHSSSNNYYKFYFFYTNVSKETFNVIQDEVLGFSNASVVFVNANEYADKYKEVLASRVNPAMYARLFICDVLDEVDRILYLDIDLLIRADVAELYQYPLGGHIVGAMPDVWCENLILRNGDGFGEYVLNVLKLPQDHYYFNSGVLLLNAKKWREEKYTQKCLEKLEEIGEPRFYDQSTLNAVCAGDVCYLPLEWNCTSSTELFYSYVLNRKYKTVRGWTKKAQKHPKIIHFLGARKAWHINIEEVSLEDSNINHIDFRSIEEWWGYARLTKSFNWFLSRNKKYDTPHVVEKKYLSLFKVKKTWFTKTISVCGFPIYKRVKEGWGRTYYLLNVLRMKISF